MGKLLLKKFSTTVLRATTTTDSTQIPAASVSIKALKQGATVSVNASVTGSDTAVTVYNVGRLAVGDNLQVGTNPDDKMFVVSKDSDTQVTLRKSTSATINLTKGDRLVAIDSLITLYSEETGTEAISNPYTVNANGLVAFYTPDTRFDYIVSGSGIVSTLVTENEGGWARGGGHTVNFTDYPSLSAAYAALPADGGTILFPAKTFDRTTIPAVDPITITKPVTLQGVSPSVGTGGTILIYKNNGTEDLTSDLITVIGDTANWTKLSGIRFQGAGAAGSGRGLVVDGPRHMLVENCQFIDFPSYTVDSRIAGADIVDARFYNCRFEFSHSNGTMRLGDVGYAGWFAPHIDSCTFQTSTEAPKILKLGYAEGVTISHTTFESNINPASANGDTAAMIYGSVGGGINKLKIYDCWFESGSTDAVPNSWFIYLVAPTVNATIERNLFNRPSGFTTSLRVVKCVADAGALYGNYYLKIADNEGDLFNATGTGTDDIVLSDKDSAFISNNCFRDGTFFAHPWRISATATGWGKTIQFEPDRLKLASLTTTQQNAMVDVHVGTIIYNSTTDKIRAYLTSGGPGWVDL